VGSLFQTCYQNKKCIFI